VHVSAMSQSFVKDPRDVVKPGDIVRVKVVEVDIPRKRISLTLRLEDETVRRPAGGRSERPRPDQPRRDRDRGGPPAGGGALADALRRAGLDKGLPGR